MKLISYLQIKYSLARRKIIQLIRYGDIKINNNTIEDYLSELYIGDKISVDLSTLGRASIKETIQSFPVVDSCIMLFHKPKGYVVSREKQEKGSDTIYDILPKEFATWDYIGRLDKDSSGLLLMTNDKKIIHKLGHPSSDLIKTYHVIVDRKLTEDQIKEFERGVRLDDFGNITDGGPLLKFVGIEQYQNQNNVKLIIKLKQGYKRHIRRVLRYAGLKIFKLHRTSFGKYKISDIKVGEYQVLHYED